jgi:tRNA pseudouridine38-40 synthase
MMRFAIGIEYDGSAYNGWQRQASGTCVQERLEAALGAVAGHSLTVHGAGRTDRGVHASGQVGHFDSESRRTLRGWLLGANSNLPADINLTWILPVAPEFHARFSARSRRYRYVVLNRRVRSALLRQRVWWVHQPLDAERMHRAGQLLLGKHDFSAFRAAGCQAKTAVRQVQQLTVDRDGDFVTIDIRADAFLQRMVRNVAGTLVEVGLCERSEAWVGEVLEGQDRTRAGAAAPPDGLTLVEVSYAREFGIPPVA